jgi:formate hydrogenlyase subunit 6/NADH:ubiquinone oxidoreductase subunit I
MKSRINEVLTLLDKKSYLRKKLFQLFAINSIEGMKFYYYMGEMSQKPYIGWFYAKLMNTYYKYVHTNSVKLPLKDIEAFIKGASHLSVGPCPCRLIFDNNDCDAPIYTCMRVNYFSETITELQDMVDNYRKKKGKKPQKTGKTLTKEEAISLVRHAHDQNLILSLESCVQPYQNNICMCCTDCCIELQMRYKFGLDVSKPGPYIPVFSAESCTGCGLCSKRCPLKAITFIDNQPSVNLEQCLGCGQCEGACSTQSISMEVVPERVSKFKEPGPFKQLYVLGLTAAMYLLFLRFQSTHESENYKYGKAKPRESDIIRF